MQLSRLSRRHLSWGVIAPAFICLATLWGALFLDARRARETALEQAALASSNLATAFQEHVRRTIGAVDDLLVTMIGAQREAGRWDLIPTWIEGSPILQGLDLHVFIAGTDGFIQASTMAVNGRVDVSDRPHYRHHLDLKAQQPYVSAPIRGRVSGRWSVQITRRIEDGAGNFRGVAIFSIDVGYFSQFFDRFDLGKRGTAALTGRDGIVRARRGGTIGELGQSISTSPLFQHLERSDKGTFRAPGAIDGVERIFSYRAVPDYPLVVSVGIATSDILAPVHQKNQVYFVGGAIVSMIAIAALAGWSRIRAIERRRREALTTRADEEIRAQKALLAATLDNMPQGVLMFSPDGRVLVANRSYSGMYSLPPGAVKPGITLRQLIGLRAQAGTFQGDIERYCADIAASIVSGKTTSWMLRTPDGRHIHAVNHPMADGGWIGTHEDVTAQKRLEEERDRNQRILDLVIENVPSTILLKNASDSSYVLINRAGERLFGMDRLKMIGRSPHDLMPKASADQVIALDRRLSVEKRKDSLDTEQTIELAGLGWRTQLTRRLHIDDENGQPQYILVLIEDITERKQLAEHLQQAQKMDAVGKLTGGIAHDFNNLLMIMIGNLEVLQGLMTEPEHLALIKSILQAATRGSQLTSQLLAFSRRQPLQPCRVDVDELLGHTVQLLRRTLGANVIVDLRLGGGVWPLMVDPAQLEAAVLNIAINARDAMPDGGTLVIKTSNRHLTPEVAAGLELAAGDHVMVEISDTGTGMPPEVTQRIFEPFFTTKGPGKGTGLGLSMVYGFMRQSAGAVAVESELRKGTTFRLYLPRTAVEAEPAMLPEAPPLAPGQACAEENVILAVDDNSEVRATAVAHLRGLGYQVVEAENAADALEILDVMTEINLLFTDIIMPGGIDGRKLAELARAKRPDLKVLYTSGYPGEGAGEQAGIDAPLLAKPYRKQALAQVVAAVLAGRGAGQECVG